MTARRLAPDQQIRRGLLIALRELGYGRSKRRRRQIAQMVARRGWRR